LLAEADAGVEEMLEVEASDGGEGESGPGAACGHDGAGGEAGEAGDDSAEDIPEVVITKRREVAVEVEGVGGWDAGMDYALGPGDARGVIEGEEAGVEVRALLEIDEGDDDEGDPGEREEDGCRSQGEEADVPGIAGAALLEPLPDESGKA